MKYEWELTDEEFGPFFPYIQDKDVTDIDYNGKMLWIADLRRGRYRADVAITPACPPPHSLNYPDNFLFRAVP